MSNPIGSTGKLRFAVIGAVLVASLVGGAYALGATATNRAISAVVGAGVMTKFPNGFRPNVDATRGEVALALHRSIPRIALGDFLDSMLASSAATNLGDVTMKIDGAPGKVQGVLINVQMQLDHDNALGTNCSASWQLTKDASATLLGSWSQELYTGPTSGEEDNIAFSMFVTQSTNTTAVYHLLGANSCTQELFIDEDIWTAQSFPLNGKGKVHPAAAAVTQRNLIPHHDQ